MWIDIFSTVIKCKLGNLWVYGFGDVSSGEKKQIISFMYRIYLPTGKYLSLILSGIFPFFRRESWLAFTCIVYLERFEWYKDWKRMVVFFFLTVFTMNWVVLKLCTHLTRAKYLLFARYYDNCQSYKNK